MDVASGRKIANEATKEGSAAPYGAVIHGIIDKAGLFNSCFFSYEFRTSNIETHNLAKHALSMYGLKFLD